MMCRSRRQAVRCEGQPPGAGGGTPCPRLAPAPSREPGWRVRRGFSLAAASGARWCGRPRCRPTSSGEGEAGGGAGRSHAADNTS